MLSSDEVASALVQVAQTKLDTPADQKVVHDLAAQLSKIAAKAEDPMLLQLGDAARHFVGWLRIAEPLVRAYTACILANIAFLEEGQQQVLQAGGIAPLVSLLKSNDDKKVTLHTTAAIQNLTYKNTMCCQAVVENEGERILKKLLQHKSEDVQQFAAGALANLQLYRRVTDEQPSTGSKKGLGMSRKVKQILRRRASADKGGEPVQGHNSEAATMIQAAYRAKLGRAEYERRKRKVAKKGNRYSQFNVSDVRNELDRNEMLPPLPSQLKKLPMGGGFGALPGVDGGRKPNRLAPLDSALLPSLSGGRLPPLPAPRLSSSGMPAMAPRMGQMPAVR